MGRTIIKGGTIHTPFEVYQADLVIEGERIAGIMLDAPTGPGDTVIDAAGLLVFPGIVDAHTHLQLDTGIYKTADNWKVSSRTAAAGGITTVIDFANQIVGESFEAALTARLADSAPSIIDYGYHMVILEPAADDDDLQHDLVTIHDLGMNSVKLFTTYRPNYYLDDAALLRIFTALPPDMIAMIHSENDFIVSDATERLTAAGKTGWRYHAQGRPAEAEAEAIGRMIRLASMASAQVYIAHVTTEPGSRLIAEARARGQAVIGETCPQYLLLDDSVYAGDHPEHYILQPPLRDKMDQSTLWGRLSRTSRDALAVVSTDSCDYTLAQKTEFAEFTKTPGGLPGLQLLLPLMYTEGVVNPRHDFDTCDLLRKLCVNPARIFGLYPQKGALLPGSDADIVLYDPAPIWEIHAADLHHIAGYSPYEGMQVQGRVNMTLSRGEVVYNHADLHFAEPGRGQFVKAGAFQPPLSAL